jgi:hypothetical protein
MKISELAYSGYTKREDEAKSRPSGIVEIGIPKLSRSENEYKGIPAVGIVY